jgi:chorismate dehydratase
MIRAHGAALLIGDPAFEADHRALGVIKTDLGEAWAAMTGLPFIYAAWTGRPGAIGPAEVEALQAAQAEGVANVDAIALEYGGADGARVARAARYLRDNVRYGLGAAEAEGLQRFLDLAADLGVAPGRRRLEFF